MAATEQQTTNGRELAEFAVRSGVTLDQLAQLENEFGPLILCGGDLGYMNPRGKFELLIGAGG